MWSSGNSEKDFLPERFVSSIELIVTLRHSKELNS